MQCNNAIRPRSNAMQYCGAIMQSRSGMQPCSAIMQCNNAEAPDDGSQALSAVLRTFVFLLQLYYKKSTFEPQSSRRANTKAFLVPDQTATLRHDWDMAAWSIDTVCRPPQPILFEEMVKIIELIEIIRKILEQYCMAFLHCIIALRYGIAFLHCVAFLHGIVAWHCCMALLHGIVALHYCISLAMGGT